MKYYFIAFPFLLSTSVMAMNDDWDASHFQTVQQEASDSSDESSSSDEDGVSFLYPCSFRVIEEEPTYANDYRPTMERIFPAPGVDLPPPEDCLWAERIPGVQFVLTYVSKNPDSTLLYSYKTLCSYSNGIDQEVWNLAPLSLQEDIFKDLMEMDHNIPNLNTFLEANPHFSQFLPSAEGAQN